MKSKFSGWAHFVAGYSSIFTLIVLFIVTADIIWSDVVPFYFYIIITVAVTGVWLWIVLGELRKKAIAIEIGYDSFVIRRYLGLGMPVTYYFEQLSGYKLSVLPARGASYEFLYLMVGDRKIAKISQFYHRNYAELKEMIVTAKVKDLGFEDYSGTREIKEIFS